MTGHSPQQGIGLHATTLDILLLVWESGKKKPSNTKPQSAVDHNNNNDIQTCVCVRELAPRHSLLLAYTRFVRTFLPGSGAGPPMSCSLVHPWSELGGVVVVIVVFVRIAGELWRCVRIGVAELGGIHTRETRNKIPSDRMLLSCVFLCTKEESKPCLSCANVCVCSVGDEIPRIPNPQKRCYGRFVCGR